MSLLSRLRRRARGYLGDLERFMPIGGKTRLVPGAAPERLAAEAYLVGTKRGLFRLDASGFTLLMRGEFYGITRRADAWYAFQKLSTRGRLIRFRLHRGHMTGGVQLDATLSEGCHQIDFVGDQLLVADTYNNALLVCTDLGGGLRRTGTHHPAGPLLSGRTSENYAHLNSIWAGPEGTFVVFHNETSKTGRPSEVVRLDQELRIAERTVTPASHAHNVVHYRGRPLYCDSQQGRLMWGQEPVFESNFFTRGLSLTANRILLGGSAYATREQRGAAKGAVFVLSPSFELLEKIEAPAMVQEIRCVTSPDLGLSNAARDTRRGGDVASSESGDERAP